MPLYRPGVKTTPVIEVPVCANTLIALDFAKLEAAQYTLMTESPPCAHFHAETGHRAGKSAYWVKAWAELAARGLSPTGRKPVEPQLIAFDDCAEISEEAWSLLRPSPPSRQDCGAVREAVRMYLHQLRTGESMSRYFRELDVFRQNGVI